jgi:hypothetical protein
MVKERSREWRGRMTPFSSSGVVRECLWSDESTSGSIFSSFGEVGFLAGGMSCGLLGRSAGF